MSVSLKAEQDRAGISGGLGSIRWKKHRNQNNPTRLTDLPKYLMGFQKMSTTDTTGARPGYRNQQAVNTEKMNNPIVANDWNGDNYGPPNGKADPFNEMLSSRQKSYNNSFVGMNANMYGVRANPNASEKIRVRLHQDAIVYGTVNSYSYINAVVVVSFPSWDNTGETIVLHSYQPYTAWGDFDEEIDIPANGHQIVKVSVQHTVPNEVGDKTYGMGIYDWSCEYV